MIPATRAHWRQTPGGGRLQIERRFSHPPETVWPAISDPARLAKWMGVEWLGEAGPLSLGARFDYRFANTGMESRGRVTAFEPPRLLEHSWFENIPPAARIRWSLSPDGEGCRLILTHTEGPPEDGPRTAAGWTQILETLAADLGEADAEAGGGLDQWRRRRDAYAAAFPPEAGRDGRTIVAAGRAGLRFERRLAAGPDAVWAALTEPEAIGRWLQAEAEVAGTVGGRFHLVLGGGASRMAGVILRWEPPAVLEYSWAESAAAGDGVVRFEIFAEAGGGVRLVLTHLTGAGADMAGFASGWHWHLDALEEALRGVAVAFDRPRWTVLQAMYEATLGPAGEGAH